jgi:predicted RNase H-like HicB family nuclease
MKRSLTQPSYTVAAEWDAEAMVWVATSDDVPGLATEAETFEALAEKLRVVVPELLELNGVLAPEAAAAVRFRIIAERDERASAVA